MLFGEVKRQRFVAELGWTSIGELQLCQLTDGTRHLPHRAGVVRGRRSILPCGLLPDRAAGGGSDEDSMPDRDRARHTDRDLFAVDDLLDARWPRYGDTRLPHRQPIDANSRAIPVRARGVWIRLSR
jgi:hypothetical protein